MKDASQGINKAIESAGIRSVKDTVQKMYSNAGKKSGIKIAMEEFAEPSVGKKKNGYFVK